VDGNGGFLARRDGVDGELWPGDHVAAGENVRLAGLAGRGVGNDGAVLIEGKARALLHAAEIDPLADGGNDGKDTQKPVPTEKEIKDILKLMGKTSPDDELNCGTCGYESCRDKAVAVFRGNADPSMCLPYIMEKNESFANNILNNSPNGLVIVNDQFEIQQLNRAAMSMLNIRSQSDVLGENIVRILDPDPFYQVGESGRSIKDQRTYSADYKKYFEQTIVYDKTAHLFICILRDVTDVEVARAKHEELSRTTAEIADKVVDKQMRIVQEIASLLGETAAETKIALTNLKESIDTDEEE
jgi:uncharacterized Fe-S cluster-containing protein